MTPRRITFTNAADLYRNLLDTYCIDEPRPLSACWDLLLSLDVREETGPGWFCLFPESDEEPALGVPQDELDAALYGEKMTMSETQRLCRELMRQAAGHDQIAPHYETPLREGHKMVASALRNIARNFATDDSGCGASATALVMDAVDAEQGGEA